MKKRILTLSLQAACLLLFFTAAQAFEKRAGGFICVNDTIDPGADFQAALAEVIPTLSPYDELRLVQDTFNIDNSTTGHFNIETDHDLAISGGWNGDCSIQTADPQLTVLKGGSAQDDPGGVLSVVIIDNASSVNVSISNMTIKNGSSLLDGGGLYVEHDTTGTAALVTLDIYDVIVQENSTLTFGSGIAVFDWGTNGGMDVAIADCWVLDNSVPNGSGGGPAGIYIDNFGSDLDVFITRCQILDNMAELDGGGIYINSGAHNATLVNNVIARNSVSDDNGGGIYIINTDGGDTILTNNTVTDNESTGTDITFQDGGGLYIELINNSSKLDIYNNIFFNNSAVGDGGDIFIFNPTGNEVDIKHNNFNGAEPAGFYIENKFLLSRENNLDNTDPLFVNGAGGDYHLTPASPVILMGDNSAPAVPSIDLDGLPRPVNTTIDMGAYEYQDAVSTTTTTTVPGTTTTTSTTLPGGTTTSTTSTTTTTTTPATSTTSTTTSTTLPGSTTTTTVPSGGGGGGGGAGIFGDILKSSVIGYHLDGFTKEGVQVYMPVTPGFKALKGAQEYVRSFAPNLAEFVRECFDFLELRADANKDGLLYGIGTRAFPVLGKIAEKVLQLIGAQEYMDKAYVNTTITVEEFKKLEKNGIAIAPKIVKDADQPELESERVYSAN